MQQQRGFTLLELMVVVTLIGVLSSIAIPNMLNFQRRARRAEATSQLGSLGKALEAYRSENGEYTAILQRVGWYPDGAPRYIYGFFGGAGTNTAFLAASTGKFSTQNMVDNAGLPLGVGHMLHFPSLYWPFAGCRTTPTACAITNCALTPGAEPGYNAIAVGNLDRDDDLDKLYLLDGHQTGGAACATGTWSSITYTQRAGILVDDIGDTSAGSFSCRTAGFGWVLCLIAARRTKARSLRS